MDTYNVIIDDVMIDNIIRTDRAEVTNLISARQVMYVILLGVLPSYFVLSTKLINLNLKRSIIGRCGLLAGSFLTIILILFSFSSSYATFLREHKLLRYYSNPTYLLYSLAIFVNAKTTALRQNDFELIALDAKALSTGNNRKLIVLVVGETVRSDHMSLNGYERNTNPLLSGREVISYTNFWACGTSTAVSVPCMFSPYTREKYEGAKVQATENVLDILYRVGTNVLWIDNNSDSKGVALRVPYLSAKSSETNDKCDIECRDVGMIGMLQSYVSNHPKGDIVVVMHQMGNHGPAYYKRYPSEFEMFTPACQTNLLENCSKEEIMNGYDNAILYTDHFLNETIDMLEGYGEEFSSSLIYISDHGESLGEYGLYLHGLPYALAPDTQKHVPLVMWFNESLRSENPKLDGLRRNTDIEYSHDNIFHTILGLTEVSSDIYQPKMDITAQ